jgi:iduronate 2-sulfatase
VLQGLAAAAVAPAQGASKPNVLFIAVDDLNVRLGCYGFPVQTPNIDALAATGVRFDRAYCQYPLCNPSRSSMLTGRRPATTGITENTTWFRKRLPDVVTLPQYFRQSGYYTASSGKIFHAGLDDDRAWEAGATPVAAGGVRKAPGTPQERQAASDRWQPLDGDGSGAADYKNVSRAIDIIEKRDPKRPLFLALGFQKPHTPFLAPKKYFDLYDPSKIPVPEDLLPEPAGTSPSIRANWDLFSVRKATPELARHAIAAYYACISFIDAQLARVMAALDKADMRQNTIVVFFGDNGWHLGEKGLWGKNTLFEASARVPLAIAAPGMKRGVCPRLVEFIDVYPTLVELCGLRQPEGLEGRSLAPLLRDPAARWDHPAFTNLQKGKSLATSVRTERYRYTEWPGADAEFFDYREDPRETRNLAGDPKYAAEIARMKAMIPRSKT